MNDSRMSFEDFVDTVAGNLRDYLPEELQDAEIRTQQFEKLNGSYLGLQVVSEGRTAIPIINMEAHYDSFVKKGADLGSMDEVLTRIAEQAQSQPVFETEWMKDYGQVKDHLFVRVSDAVENSARLKNMPHQEVDGLAITCHIALDGPGGAGASTPVTYDLLRSYGINEQQLHEDALAGSMEHFPVVFVSMAEMMSRMMGIDADMMPPQEGPELMILSNETALYGAGALFYPGQLDEIAQQVGGDYYIIPSSIHEVILVPDDGSIEREALDSMIREVNTTVVNPEDRLADDAYHYDAKDHVLEKASTFEHRMEQKELEAEKAAMQKSMRASVKDAARAEGERPQENAKKERRSVLARLSEKKEQAAGAPKKNTPERSKGQELGS